ncbi:GATA Zn-finger-containing transcription factor [Tubulinosema ratisbonensis]|uniref:GATA Zn-finger-containing transcription factor n=1 Tax=Tubulinosema ratisbonensis TaxID=291195 RepID=A0A437AJK3_9MICR|nr:GATA Zn-finger-containing transcription factor [Tubulinosema ratisbonensis]
MNFNDNSTWNSQKDENEVQSYGSYEDFDYDELNRRLSDQFSSKMMKGNFLRSNKFRVCSNCRTRDTSIWRWSEDKNFLLCNACGLYEKSHKKNRPVVLTEEGVSRILKKTEIFNNCVLCDAVITDILPEYKALCFKCSRISDTIDVHSFFVFHIHIPNKEGFGKGGKFYKFRVYK